MFRCWPHVKDTDSRSQGPSLCTSCDWYVWLCRAPLKEPPCIKEREACIQCYKENVQVSTVPIEHHWCRSSCTAQSLA